MYHCWHLMEEIQLYSVVNSCKNPGWLKSPWKKPEGRIIGSVKIHFVLTIYQGDRNHGVSISNKRISFPWPLVKEWNSLLAKQIYIRFSLFLKLKAMLKCNLSHLLITTNLMTWKVFLSRRYNSCWLGLFWWKQVCYNRITSIFLFKNSFMFLCLKE